LERKTATQLAMSFGVVPYHHTGSPDTLIHETMRYAVEAGLAKPGQVAAITSGQVIGFLEGTTTKMQVLQIPDFAAMA
jgi:pyruvate kinase